MRVGVWPVAAWSTPPLRHLPLFLVTLRPLQCRPTHMSDTLPLGLVVMCALKTVVSLSHSAWLRLCSMPCRSYPATCRAKRNGGGKADTNKVGAAPTPGNTRLRYGCLLPRCTCTGFPRRCGPARLPPTQLPPTSARTCSRKGGCSLGTERQRHSRCSVSVPFGQMPSSRDLSSCQRGGTPAGRHDAPAAGLPHAAHPACGHGGSHRHQQQHTVICAEPACCCGAASPQPMSQLSPPCS